MQLHKCGHIFESIPNDLVAANTKLSPKSVLIQMAVAGGYKYPLFRLEPVLRTKLSRLRINVSSCPVLSVMGTEVLCKLAFIQKMRSLPQLWAECPTLPHFGPFPRCLPLALMIWFCSADRSSQQLAPTSDLSDQNDALAPWLSADRLTNGKCLCRHADL